MPKKIITVKTKIGKCIYNIEMDKRESIYAIIIEIERQMDIKDREIEILEIYDQFNPKTTRPHKNGNTA